MAIESVKTTATPVESQPSFHLPIKLVDEANKLFYQCDAMLTCMADAADNLDDPKTAIDGVVWVVREKMDRLKEICNAKPALT